MNWKWLQGLTPFAMAAVLSAAPSFAWATPLSPGGKISPDGANGSGIVAGNTTIVAGTNWEASSTANGTGAIREVVVQGDTSNPYGGLDFIFQLHNTSSANTNLAALIASSFGSYKTDVVIGTQNVSSSFSYDGSSFGTPANSGAYPFTVTRSSDGSQVTANFGDNQGYGALSRGSYSDLLVVHTNATSYNPGDMSFTDTKGGASGQLSGFGAAAMSSSPEPASATLLGGCLACLGLAAAWRRRKATQH